MEHPRTLAEWKVYVQSLSGERLWREANAANTPAFMILLRDEEGLPAADITAILTMFARRLVEEGQRPPGKGPGAYLDMAGLLRRMDQLEPP